MKKPAFLLAGILFLALATGRAEVKLPAVFSDHMVLQRDMEIPVWGSASPGEKVTVTLGAGSTSAQADSSGKWSVRLPKMPASATPTELKAAASNTVTIKDVLVGDVWVCSGQSNMAFSLGRAATAKEALATANSPVIRLFTVPKNSTIQPQSNCASAWVVCAPNTAEKFSAVGYFFGKEIADTQKIPVGLIGTHVGGTPAEAWSSLESLQSDKTLNEVYASRFTKLAAGAEAAKAAHDQWLANGGSEYLAAVQKQRAAAAAAKQKGAPPPPVPPAPATPEPPLPTSQSQPTVLFNGMVAPIIPFGIKGAIWYQGESNAGQAAVYRKLFSAMIQGWRKCWGQGDFPFLFVQLPNFGKRDDQPTALEIGWPALREAQLMTLNTVPNTGMAITMDVGNPNDIHPTFKAEVGHRLALYARHLVYGENLLHSGPLYASHKIEGNQVVIKFTHAGDGLKIAPLPVTLPGRTPPPTDELVGFAIAGADKKFVWAKAAIQGPDTVVVSSTEVPSPVSVRYAWGADPAVNLYNSGDLPASPFRIPAPENP